MHVSRQLGKLGQADFEQAAQPLDRRRRHHEAIRPFLDRVFAPAHEYLVPADDETLVCRCEEVSTKRIREAVSLGCIGPNQIKSFTRCGMGPCQGAQCGSTMAWIIAMN
ncbi:MAG: (2Fe-2S)-binding protein [Sedimenticola sp.]